jgi:hypothetical protein
MRTVHQKPARSLPIASTVSQPQDKASVTWTTRVSATLRRSDVHIPACSDCSELNRRKFIGGFRQCSAMLVCQNSVDRKPQTVARPYVAKTIRTKVQHMHRDVLGHPAHSPDLNPRDFHIFEPPKQALKERRTQSDAQVTSSRKASSAWWLSGTHIWMRVVTDWAQ